MNILKYKFTRIFSPVFFLVVILVSGNTLSGEDYQYQYFSKEKKKYVPFSDYIPRIRKHWQTVPHYLEDYYQLYGLKQYYNENTLRKNIERLKTALRCKFRHPSMALIKITTEQEYLKYRKLMFMHINMLIMRNHLKIAARYDKRKIYFHSRDYAQEISESLDIAEKYYKHAFPYWREAVKHARGASKIKITTDLGFIESERYSIVNGELDYDKIISGYIKDITNKKKRLQSFTSK